MPAEIPRLLTSQLPDKITPKINHIRIILYLENNKYATGALIMEDLSMGYSTLNGVMNILVKAGYVKSQKGPPCEDSKKNNYYLYWVEEDSFENYKNYELGV
jgi:DNA-binding MarR family transcriptional regulator